MHAVAVSLSLLYGSCVTLRSNFNTGTSTCFRGDIFCSVGQLLKVVFLHIFCMFTDKLELST